MYITVENWAVLASSAGQLMLYWLTLFLIWKPNIKIS